MSAPFPINHDLHLHTNLSACCSDPELTAAYVRDFAQRYGYNAVCITNHLWDAAVLGPSEWYAPQDIDHIRRILPLPEAEGTKVLFGCETEYCGGKKLGLAPEHFDIFDMIVIPVNHFHMPDFVRPADCDTVEKVSELLICRLEELLDLDLPWTKVGIAHLSECIYMKGESYACALERIEANRLRRVFRRLAQKGAGIELNATCFGPDWLDNPNGALRLLRTAREEGCTFYCASDAHTRQSLSLVPERMRAAADAIGLSEADLYMPPKARS